MGFTPEQRARGLATRLANKAARDAEKAGTNGRVLREVVTRLHHESPESRVPPPPTISNLDVPLDWERCPLNRALEALANFKREYEAAAQIVLRRQQTSPAIWTCWTRTHKELAPKMTRGQCRGSIPDGKWVFKDDGVFEDRDGVRVQAPVVCCSQLCYTAYVSNKPVNSLSRH